MMNKGRLELRIYPDPILARPCEPVKTFGDEVARLTADMSEAMREFNGVGLAANQVGVSLRIFVIAGEALGTVEDLVAINPEILQADEAGELEEGCLSLPGVRYKVEGRSRRIVLRHQAVDGSWREAPMEGLAALCAQHELDHLNGVTMLDRVSPLKAARAKAKLLKARRPSP